MVSFLLALVVPFSGRGRIYPFIFGGAISPSAIGTDKDFSQEQVSRALLYATKSDLCVSYLVLGNETCGAFSDT